MLLTGLSVAVAFQAGLFNIGGEGQLYLGAIGAAYLGTQFPWLSSVAYIPFILTLSAAIGAGWALIAALLKIKRGIHEVISTIMLNYIAIYLTDYLVSAPLRVNAFSSKTADILESARLKVIWDLVVVQLSWGFPLALAACIMFYIFIKFSVAGYKLRLVGANSSAAEYGGVNKNNQILKAMGLSGACTGLAGALIILGQQHTFYAQFSPGYGYDGIAVALLANNNPLGVIPAAFFFGGLRSADRWIQLKAGIPKELVFIIQGLTVLLVGMDKLFTKSHQAKILHRSETRHPRRLLLL